MRPSLNGRLVSIALLLSACSPRPEVLQYRHTLGKQTEAQSANEDTKTPKANSSTPNDQKTGNGPGPGQGSGPSTPPDSSAPTKPSNESQNPEMPPEKPSNEMENEQPGPSMPPKVDEKPMPTPMPEPVVDSQLADCPGSPAINQLQKWWAAEGQMNPGPTTNIVQKEGGKSIAKVTFIGNDWHVVPVWLGNVYGYSTDISRSKGLTITYKSAGEFFIQMRPAKYWSGGAKHGTKFAASPDKFTTVTVPFDTAHWGQIPGLGAPPFTWEEALKDASGMVIVGKVPGEYVFTAMVIEGFTPPCK